MYVGGTSVDGIAENIKKTFQLADTLHDRSDYCSNDTFSISEKVVMPFRT
jgi:hypothetical protein